MKSLYKIQRNCSMISGSELGILEMQESMDHSPALGLILVLGHFFRSVTLLNFKNSLT